MKTHTQLGITAEEHAALLTTIEVLQDEQRAIIFDMSTQGTVTDDNGDPVEPLEPVSLCDTNACIGGTMSLLMQNGMKLPATVTPEMLERMVDYVDAQDRDERPMKALFWGNTEPDVTPAEGIIAIRNFLNGNTADPWLEA